MNLKRIKKESFVVIGKEGSTLDGKGFVEKLWLDANAHFDEIEHLVKKDANGKLCGIWGVMSDFSRTFLPWQNNFSEGLYLAGVECKEDAIAPSGWTKWIIPGYEYLYVECEEDYPFNKVIAYMQENNISLEGAAYDYTCPTTRKDFIFFPIKKL